VWLATVLVISLKRRDGRLARHVGTPNRCPTVLGR
jgi:hypothetical protein